MDSIRVNSGVKVIEVNDKGETISRCLMIALSKAFSTC